MNNVLNGTAQADTLDGAGAADRMVGGGGSDTYLVDNALDLAGEAAKGGTDTVIASVDDALGSNVENLVLTGAGHRGTGNALANHLTGTKVTASGVASLQKVLTNCKINADD